MNRYLIIYLVILTWSLNCHAQQYDSIVNQYQNQFNSFARTIENQHAQFKNKNDSIFYHFLKDSWKSYQAFYNEKIEANYPKKQPVSTSDTLVPETYELKFKKKQQGIKPNKKKVTPTKKSIREINDYSKFQKAEISFYGTPINYSPLDIAPVDFDHISNKILEENFILLSNSETIEQLITELLSIKHEYNLNDWVYLKLVERVIENTQYRSNQKILITWIILTKSHLQVKLGYTSDFLCVLVASQQEIFNTYCFEIDHTRYYFVDLFDLQRELKQLIIHESGYPDQIQLSLLLDKLPNLNYRSLMKGLNYNNQSIAIEIDETLITIYEDYPLCDMKVHFTTPLSLVTLKQLDVFLKPFLNGKTNIEKLEVLLDFVQQSIKFKNDNEQFGGERYLFAEEVLKYQQADCEDRCILLYGLIKKYTNYNAIALSFPGHISLGVSIENIKRGAYVNYLNTKYYVCDPTYINAGIGEHPSQLKHFQPEIITFE